MEKTQELRAPPNPKDEEFCSPEREIKGVHSDIEPQDTVDGDEDQLARLGKKQVLKVRINVESRSSRPADGVEELWILVHVGL